ncbi:MarR family winged helix-turn-helix transcriptional regulator [Saccharomonospora xinjiangensis]|uniref:Transcriptional regulator n=1 Tax=Saccharomonospora xinjiangensis XJ-54 TaxID=882086 RepID=I0V8E3_9PSEU|nr:MarR family transcriptional regulator [Saccharomonospora xinjiangensis]EID56396.1 transcriptional regulator [Saccharomonospora xinjiangensis XJ-54]
MTRWLDDHEQRAWRGYLAMHAKLTARLSRQLQTESGLSLSDFEVLVQLTDQPEPRMRIGRLAVALQWEKSRLSHHLARMQKRGLVCREDCPSDARGSFVVLTDRGREAIERAAPGHVATVRDLVFDQLTPEQVSALASIAESVQRRLDASEYDTQPTPSA